MLIVYIRLLCTIKNFQFGDGIYFEGEYKQDNVYDLYIQCITCSFELKNDKIPTIQIKNNSTFFLGNEYLTNSNGEIVCLYLTNIDLKLFLEQYKTEDLEYLYGWKFRSINGLFTKYIDKWIAVKNQATIEENSGLRATAKLMLNSLYGKFAKSMELKSKIPYLSEDEIVKYDFSDKEIVKGIYIPIASFITAYAREITIRASQSIKDYSIKNYGKDMYIYSDTDSIHTTLSIEELKKFCDIDSVKLGAWKHEGFAKKAKFVRQKCYLEEIYDKKKEETKLKITCAGMPKNCYENVTWENFKTGFKCGGKLTFKHVKGGVLLVETEFTIKDPKQLKINERKNKK